MVGTAVRVENNVVIVVMVDLTDDLGEAPQAVTQAAVDRLAAVSRRRGPADPGRGARGLRPGRRWGTRPQRAVDACRQRDRPAGDGSPPAGLLWCGVAQRTAAAAATTSTRP